ncbi:hypothetical protein HPB50_016022 [Hyalomma asiaticum]|uniref:Uncharacterized protein n=1 Tax=Hyalomma asiaticum TaxID=266040 RepID=A0ACB7T853_HYAAI|nr:hypothetical protein HPB50_016022 [Hyalomma asiaticum]
MVRPTGRLLPRYDVGVLVAAGVLNLRPSPRMRLFHNLATHHCKPLGVPATRTLRRTEVSLPRLTGGQLCRRKMYQQNRCTDRRKLLRNGTVAIVMTKKS